MNIQSSTYGNAGLSHTDVALSPVRHNAEQAQKTRKIAQQDTRPLANTHESRGTLLDILV